MGDGWGRSGNLVCRRSWLFLLVEIQFKQMSLLYSNVGHNLVGSDMCMSSLLGLRELQPGVSDNISVMVKLSGQFHFDHKDSLKDDRVTVTCYCICIFVSLTVTFYCNCIIVSSVSLRLQGLCEG